jgi:hypothetical protein
VVGCIRSGRQLQGIYNQSLDSGIAHGRQCNTVASKNLFLFLWSQMKDDDGGEYSGDLKSWSRRKWGDYYRRCAAILQRPIKLR